MLKDIKLNAKPDNGLFKKEYMKFGWGKGDWTQLSGMILNTDKRVFSDMVKHWNDLPDRKPKENKDLKKRKRANSTNPRRFSFRSDYSESSSRIRPSPLKPSKSLLTIAEGGESPP